MDYRKTVENVPHERLLDKLKAFRINISTRMWIHSFLTDRGQKVSVNGLCSNLWEVHRKLHADLNVT